MREGWLSALEFAGHERDGMVGLRRVTRADKDKGSHLQASACVDWGSGSASTQAFPLDHIGTLLWWRLAGVASWFRARGVASPIVSPPELAEKAPYVVARRRERKGEAPGYSGWRHPTALLRAPCAGERLSENFGLDDQAELLPSRRGCSAQMRRMFSSDRLPSSSRPSTSYGFAGSRNPARPQRHQLPRPYALGV